MNCAVWIAYLVVMKDPVARYDMTIAKAMHPWSTEQQYNDALAIFPKYEKAVLKRARKGKLEKQYLTWTYSLDYHAGPLQKKLIDLERKLEAYEPLTSKSEEDKLDWLENQ